MDLEALLTEIEGCTLGTVPGDRLTTLLCVAMERVVARFANRVTDGTSASAHAALVARFSAVVTSCMSVNAFDPAFGPDCSVEEATAQALASPFYQYIACPAVVACAAEHVLPTSEDLFMFVVSSIFSGAGLLSANNTEVGIGAITRALLTVGVAPRVVLGSPFIGTLHAPQALRVIREVTSYSCKHSGAVLAAYVGEGWSGRGQARQAVRSLLPPITDETLAVLRRAWGPRKNVMESKPIDTESYVSLLVCLILHGHVDEAAAMARSHVARVNFRIREQRNTPNERPVADFFSEIALLVRTITATVGARFDAIKDGYRSSAVVRGGHHARRVLPAGEALVPLAGEGSRDGSSDDVWALGGGHAVILREIEGSVHIALARVIEVFALLWHDHYTKVELVARERATAPAAQKVLHEIAETMQEHVCGVVAALVVSEAPAKLLQLVAPILTPAVRETAAVIPPSGPGRGPRQASVGAAIAWFGNSLGYLLSDIRETMLKLTLIAHTSAGESLLCTADALIEHGVQIPRTPVAAARSFGLDLVVGGLVEPCLEVLVGSQAISLEQAKQEVLQCASPSDVQQVLQSLAVMQQLFPSEWGRQQLSTLHTILRPAAVRAVRSAKAPNQDGPTQKGAKQRGRVPSPPIPGAVDGQLQHVLRRCVTVEGVVAVLGDGLLLPGGTDDDMFDTLLDAVEHDLLGPGRALLQEMEEGRAGRGPNGRIRHEEALAAQMVLCRTLCSTLSCLVYAVAQAHAAGDVSAIPPTSIARLNQLLEALLAPAESLGSSLLPPLFPSMRELLAFIEDVLGRAHPNSIAHDIAAKHLTDVLHEIATLHAVTGSVAKKTPNTTPSTQTDEILILLRATNRLLAPEQHALVADAAPSGPGHCTIAELAASAPTPTAPPAARPSTVSAAGPSPPSPRKRVSKKAAATSTALASTRAHLPSRAAIVKDLVALVDALPMEDIAAWPQPAAATCTILQTLSHIYTAWISENNLLTMTTMNAAADAKGKPKQTAFVTQLMEMLLRGLGPQREHLAPSEIAMLTAAISRCLPADTASHKDLRQRFVLSMAPHIIRHRQHLSSADCVACLEGLVVAEVVHPSCLGALFLRIAALHAHFDSRLCIALIHCAALAGARRNEALQRSITLAAQPIVRSVLQAIVAGGAEPLLARDGPQLVDAVARTCPGDATADRVIEAVVGEIERASVPLITALLRLLTLRPTTDAATLRSVVRRIRPVVAAAHPDTGALLVSHLVKIGVRDADLFAALDARLMHIKPTIRGIASLCALHHDAHRDDLAHVLGEYFGTATDADMAHIPLHELAQIAGTVHVAVAETAARQAILARLMTVAAPHARHFPLADLKVLLVAAAHAQLAHAGLRHSPGPLAFLAATVRHLGGESLGAVDAGIATMIAAALIDLGVPGMFRTAAELRAALPTGPDAGAASTDAIYGASDATPGTAVVQKLLDFIYAHRLTILSRQMLLERLQQVEREHPEARGLHPHLFEFVRRLQ